MGTRGILGVMKMFQNWIVVRVAQFCKSTQNLCLVYLFNKFYEFYDM